MWTLLVAIASAAQPELVFRISTQVEAGVGLVTNSLAFEKNQTMKAVVNFNYPDLIVPICNETNCLERSKIDAFCADPSFCMDRASPPFQCKQVVDHLDNSVVSTHSVDIGGAKFALQTFEFLQDLSFGSYNAKQVPLKGLISRGEEILLGLGPSRMSCRNETLISHLGIDYFQIDSAGISFWKNYDSLAVWTEPYLLASINASSTVGKYAFSSYAPTVCGVDLLGNVSSHWTTLIDSTVKCLTVPAFLAERIAVWKPGSDKRLYLYLTDQRDAHASGRPIGIDLTKVCLESHPRKSPVLTASDPIVLGYDVINALTAFDSIGFETAFPFRINFGTHSREINPACSVARPACIGDQIYYEPENKCIDPDCSQYILSELDRNTRTCKSRSFVPTAVYFAILVLVCGEVLIFALKRKINSLAQLACERTELST